MNEPSVRLSVVIPGYNTSDWMWCRCIKSVLAAISQGDEIVCVDDCSSKTLDVEGLLERVGRDDRVRFLRLNENLGAAGARNKALDVAAGKYVTFVDSDDEILPGIYDQCIERLQCCSSDIAVFGVKVIWTDNGLYKVDVPRGCDYGRIEPLGVKELFDGCLFEYPVNKIYKRSFLDSHGIRFKSGVCPGEDTAFNLECLLCKPRVVSVGRAGYVYYRMEGTSLSRAYPFIRKSLTYRTKLWRRYKAENPGAKELLGDLGEYDEPRLVVAEWGNFWRRGAAATWSARWHFLQSHRELGRNLWVEFMRMSLKTFLRRYCYFRPIRRWHIKRLFPNVQELRMKKFDAIMNIPSPYRVYLFGELNRQLSVKDCDFIAHFMAKGHGERPKSWLNPQMNFAYVYWSDFGVRHHHFNPGFIVRSWFHRPDVLLVGSPFDTITGILSAFTARARVKCTWVEGQTKTPGRLNGFIGWFKRLVLSRFKFVAVPGSDAAKYIGLHQARTRRPMPTPVILPNLIDESRFSPRQEWSLADLETCRKLFGAAVDERVCLIPARLAEVKGLVPFVRALDATLVNAGWRIVVLGQGPLKQEILNAAVEKGIEGRLTILDYIPYEQMPICYAAADLMLLPSLHDPNPLSVPEALHSGLPIALSDQAGNVEEGVTVGRNGWRLPVKNPVAFKAVLAEIFATPKERLREMGECSKWENATFWDTEKAIARFLDQIGV